MHIWGRKHVIIHYKVAQEESKKCEGCQFCEKSVSAHWCLGYRFAFLKLKCTSEMMARLRRGGGKQNWEKGEQERLRMERE